MADRALKIGELAGRAGVSAKAIRFYEATAVLPLPARGANGYRLYPAGAVDVVRFVKRAQGLGLTLAEVKEIVTIRQGGRPPCTHVYRLLQEKARELDQKLRDLVLLRRRIRRGLAAWGRRLPARLGPVPALARCSPRHVEERAQRTAAQVGRRGEGGGSQGGTDDRAARGHCQHAFPDLAGRPPLGGDPIW